MAEDKYIASNSFAMLTTSENDFAKFRSEGGIVTTEFKPGCILGPMEAKLAIAERLSVQPFRKCGLLFEMTSLCGCSKEGRDLLFMDGLTWGTSAAFVCGNPLTSQIASFCLSIYPLSIPCRIFKNNQEAAAFLAPTVNKNPIQ
jgi:hypothetical protein